MTLRISPKRKKYYVRRAFALLLLASFVFVVYALVSAEITIRRSRALREEIESLLSETVPAQSDAPTVTAYRAPAAPAPARLSREEFRGLEREAYAEYLVSRGVSEERAEELIGPFYDTGTDIPVSLGLAIMGWETGFRNVFAADLTIEDSAGYVQMQSATRETVRNLYPDLPEVSSQEEFIASPEVQVLYMIRFLEYLREGCGWDFGCTVSRYNMGQNSDAMNWAYVQGVYGYKTEIELFVDEYLKAARPGPRALASAS